MCAQTTDMLDKKLALTTIACIFWCYIQQETSSLLNILSSFLHFLPTFPFFSVFYIINILCDPKL